MIAYPEFLLPLWCHETLLGLLACGGLLQAFPDFGLLAVDFGPFLFLRLESQRMESASAPVLATTTDGYVMCSVHGTLQSLDCPMLIIKELCDNSSGTGWCTYVRCFFQIC